MNVIEIFASIDGEGSRQGLLTTFLRLHDCNIRCSYCDTTYSYGIDSTFTDMTVREVADAIESLGNHRITITGGEPLLQEAAVVELIDELNRRKSAKLEDKLCVDKQSTTGNNVSEDAQDVLDSESPYDFNIETNGTIIPSFHRENVWFTYDYKTPSAIIDYMKEHNLQNVRFQLQIHKFVWDPDAKGV